MLDHHIESSEFIGYDDFGHAQFDTKRTLLGELVYRLKYKNDETVLDEIVRIIAGIWPFKGIDVIVPVPPSNISRTSQPVALIAKRSGESLGIPVLPGAIRKAKNTPELKNVSTQQERYDIRKEAFEVVDRSIEKKSVLLLDDLYRSGATLKAITEVLYKQGKVLKVKVLALTKTKKR